MLTPFADLGSVLLDLLPLHRTSGLKEILLDVISYSRTLVNVGPVALDAIRRGERVRNVVILPHLALREMERTVAALTRHYPRRDEASQQALAVLNQFPSLVNPEQSDFTYDDGRVELLLSLTGVLPVPIGANTYHCPVAIWLPLDFPSKPPIVYVLPNETLQIRKGKHVDANGQVSVPYLDNWERKSEGCSLTSLVNELIPVFSARYPLSPVQPKPKPPSSAANSSAVGPPPRPAPPPAAQSTQSVPPRPAPPPSVSPSGSTSISSGPPPRPALPTQSATMGPGVPSRPQSTLYEQPTRSTSLSLDGRSGSPVAPPRPPPPCVDGHAGSGMPSMGRALPGSFSSPPLPPAYPAHPPLAPPVPPPQRPVSVAYASPPPFGPSRGGIFLPGQPQPDVTGQPTPPAPHLGWQPPHDPRTSTASLPNPPMQVTSSQPPQAGAPTFPVDGSPGFPAPAQVHNTGITAGGADPMPMATQSHHPRPPQAVLASMPDPHTQSAAAAAATASRAPPAHDPRPSDTRSFRPQEERRSSLGSTQSFRSATPPQHAVPARATARGDAARSYSPAPSETDTVHSYASSARPPPEQYWSESTPIHARRADHRTSQPPLPRSLPPPAHAVSPLPPHLMYDRAQTHSPAPLSEVESHASSRTQEYDSGGASRARGPRAPGPPSEYSATGEYGSFARSSSASTVSGPTYDGPTPSPAVQHAGGPTRSMTVSYESRQPYDAYPFRGTDQAFEPVIEARSPPAPPQPPRPPVPSEHPPPTPTASEYTAVSGAFVPQRQYTQQVDPTAYHAGYGPPPPQLPHGPPAPASMASYTSSSAYGHADRPGTQPPYGHPGVNGFAPPFPVVAASPALPAPRAARKARPASAVAPPKPVNILDAADDDLDSSAPPSSPSTVVDPHAAAASVAGSDSISNVGGGARGAPSQAPPPVPPNPALLALRTRVHSKFTSALAHLAHSTEAELARLDLMRVDLEKAQPAIEDEMARLEAVRSVCAGVRDRYAQVVGEAQQRMREYEARGDGVDVDEIVCGSTVVYTQLLDLVAEDAALEDTIYALGRGLNSGGTANIDLDRFLKRVRALAKEQFVVRATINKILAGLAERRNARESQQLAAGGGRTGTPNSAADGGVGAHNGRGGRGTPANGV